MAILALHTDFKSDTFLWQAFKKGDREAFEQLYNMYFKELGRYGLRLNSNNDLVEDAIQDVFVDLWRRKEYLSDVENVKFYLYRAVRNQFNRTIQKDIFEGSEDINNFLDYLGTLSTEQESIENESNQIRARSIENAMNNLSNRQAEAIHLRFYQGLSLDEIALLMKIQKQVVKNLLSKSYIILKVSLKSLLSILPFLLLK